MVKNLVIKILGNMHIQYYLVYLPHQIISLRFIN